MHCAHEFPFIALVRRELLRSVRARYLSGAMMILCGFGSVALAVGWPTEDVSPVGLSTVSYGILALFASLSAAAVCLLLPGLAGGALVEERSLDTLDLMRMTLIRPIGIVAGKFVNCIGAFLLLLIAVMPLVATTYFLIGVDWDALLFILFTVTLSAVTCVSVGLACSASHRSPLRAILASYIWCAFALGGYMVLVYVGIVLAFLYYGEAAIESIAPRILYAGFSTTPPSLLLTVFGGGFSAKVSYAVLIQAAFSATALFVAWRKLCRPLRDTVLPHGADSRRAKDRRRLPVGFSAKPRKPIGDRRNPVFVREARHTGLLTGVNRWRMVFLYAALGFIALLFCAGLFYLDDSALYPQEYDEIVVMFLQLLFYIFIGLSPALMATAFVREDEQNTKDLLRMTLLTPREIALGKLQAGVVGLARLCMLLCIASWPLIVVFVRAPHACRLTLFASIWTSIVVAGAFAISAIASMYARRTAFSVPLAYGLCAAVFFGPSFTLLALNEVLDQVVRVNIVDEVVFALSPILYPLINFERLMRGVEFRHEWRHVALLQLVIAFFYVYAALRFAGKYWMRRTSRLHL